MATIREQHLLSDYSREVKGVSRINGREISLGYVMDCPRCKQEQPEPPHGAEVECPKCELRMRAMGNSLTLFVKV